MTAATKEELTAVRAELAELKAELKRMRRELADPLTCARHLAQLLTPKPKRATAN
jgi:hypothetical protein